MNNTLNICISHIPFPEFYKDYVDLTISPIPISNLENIQVVDDSHFGENGSALSEYAQLLWLGDNLDTVAKNFEYVRLFQYRRFVSRKSMGIPISLVGRWIHVNRLADLEDEISRENAGELFNPPVFFLGGVRRQYAVAHMLEDLLNFARYLTEAGILDEAQAKAMLSRHRLIPACTTGIYRVETLKKTLPILRRAAEFLNSKYYIPRAGYQRRLVGFLLERLHSHLHFNLIQSGSTDAKFGHYIVFSNSPFGHIWRLAPKALTSR